MLTRFQAAPRASTGTPATAAATPFVFTRSTDANHGSSAPAPTAATTAPPTSLTSTYPVTTLSDYDPSYFAPGANTTLRVSQLAFYDDQGLVQTKDIPQVFRTGTLVVASVRIRMWNISGNHVRCVRSITNLTHELTSLFKFYQAIIESMRLFDQSHEPDDSSFHLQAPPRPVYSPLKRSHGPRHPRPQHPHEEV